MKSGTSRDVKSRLYFRAAGLLGMVLIVSALRSASASEEAKRQIDILIQELGDREVGRRREAAACFHLQAEVYSDAEVEKAVPALAEALNDRDQQVWYHCVSALARWGFRAHKATDALMNGLRSRSGQVQYRSAYALGCIGASAVPVLAEALKTPVRANAILALGWAGSAAEPVVPALVAALADRSESVRRRAAEALARIGRAAVSALAAALSDAQAEVRYGAASALNRLASDAEAAREPLLRVLQDPSPDVRCMALRAVSKLAFAPRELVPLLDARLDDAAAEVRRTAVDILGRMGSEAQSSVDALRTLAREDADPRVRRRAEEALAMIVNSPSSRGNGR